MSERVEGHIVALGGGGFSTEADNSLLDDFILSLSARQPARVCFLPTASADSAMYIAKFYRAFSHKSHACDLTLFDPSSLPRRPSRSSELPDYIGEQDIFYVGGGSTANLLALWRAHGVDSLLRDAWQNGAIMAGISAGMICWFEGGLSDSFGDLGPIEDGLGLLEGFACPHYDSEPERVEAFQGLIDKQGSIGYAAEDGVALHFQGTEFREAVASRREAQAHRLFRTGDARVNESLPARYLGDRGGVRAAHER